MLSFHLPEMDLRIPILLALILPAPLIAEETEAPRPPSKQVVLKALQWMQSSESKRRQAAYRSVHLLGKEAMPSFRKALRRALQYHERRLADALSSRNQGGNPYHELVTITDDLKAERIRIMPLMMKDWKKDSSEIDKLRLEFERLEDLYQKAANLAVADTTNLDKQIKDVIDALVEIHDQLARFEGQTKEEAEELSAEERKQAALKESFDGDSYMKAAKVLGQVRSEVASLASADQHNEESSWASGPQKNFAQIISYERVVMGLSPLRLESKLSEAATGHSQDMKTLSFFSHTSPVPGKKSFTDRARRASYRGAAVGECIAAGYGNAAAAYRGWFYSDGHRHIMLSRRANVLGIGLAGSHWTFMPGWQ